MADQRKEYIHHVNGIPHTKLMDPEEAEKAGLKAGGAKAVTPDDTSASADNKAGSARTK